MIRSGTLFIVIALICLISISGFTAGKADVADAAMRSDLVTLRALLQQKADVNARQVDGATALHWAVFRDNLDAARLLIGAGAMVDAMNRDGITPLHMASLYGNTAMIQTLLKAGADAKQKGPQGETMVMLAARNGNPDVVKLLLAAGTDVNARERARNTTALMWAVEQKHTAALLRKLMTERGLPVPPVNRVVDSICIVELCKERQPQQ